MCVHCTAHNVRVNWKSGKRRSAFVNYSNRILFRVITVTAATMTALHARVRLRLHITHITAVRAVISGGCVAAGLYYIILL